MRLQRFGFLGFLGCLVAFPASAQSGGQQIFASGGEQGWVVVLGPDETSVTVHTPDYPIFYILPAATMVREGNRTVYRTRFDNGDTLTLSLERRPCTDDWGDVQTFTATVSGRDLEGTGCADFTEYYGPSGTVGVENLDMNSQITSTGGPDGFALTLTSSGLLLVNTGAGEREFGRPPEAYFGTMPWPEIVANTAKFRFEHYESGDAADVTISAAQCRHAGVSYPMSIALTLGNKSYSSCGAHAFMTVMPVEPVYPQSFDHQGDE